MKNKVTAGVLALLVGFLGIHRFYLGQTGKGILYLIFCWFPLIWLITFIDGITILTMDDEKFDRKYNPELFDGEKGGRESYQQPYNKRGRDYEQDYRRQRSANPNRNRDIRTPRDAQEAQNRRRGLKKPIRKSNRFKNEGTKLYRDYDFQGAIDAYKKSLKVEPNDPQIHFNMACLYSLMEDTQSAYMHLSTAVKQGYVDFDRVKTHNHLAYLRTHPEFEQFVKNGYSFQAQLNAAPQPIMELTDDVIVKLERLSQLKDKGILTEEEFQKQKAIIMRKL